MKVKLLKCPACNANLQISDGRKMCFCEYCGQQIFIDDEIKRTEHTRNINYTYTRVDEARKLEAAARLRELELAERQEETHRRRLDIEASREKRRSRRKFFFPLLFLLTIIGLFALLIAYADAEVKKDRQIEESIRSSVASSISDVCKQNQASIKSLSVSVSNVKTYITLSIEANDPIRSSIDKLQADIISSVEMPSSSSLEVYFSTKDRISLRTISINEFGHVTVYHDDTNTVSDEDAAVIVSQYQEPLEKACVPFKAKVNGISYSANTLNISVIYDRHDAASVEKIEDAIISVVDAYALHHVPLDIRILDADRDYIREIKVNLNNEKKYYSDYTNTISDEEAQKIVADYTKKIQSVCNKNHAELTEIEIKHDTIQIEIRSEYETTDSINNLANKLGTVFSSLKRFPLEIRVSSKERGTLRRWTVDENGVSKISVDFTKDD